MPITPDIVPKPTTILTGFLGAGKTTYLNHILQYHPDTRYAIIENEYGEQSIDSELILHAEDDIIELNNGCLCCTLNDNLYEILNTLHERRNEYDELLIEATGIANPVGLAEPFVVNPVIKKHFPLSRIICLVDAEQIEDQLEQTKEAMLQITFSDVLLINKTDLVSENYLLSVETLLAKLNPLAKIVFSQQGRFPGLEAGLHNPKFNELHFPLGPKSAVALNDFPVHKSHTHHHHEHTQEVVSHTLIFNRPFQRLNLLHYLNAYLIFQSRGLYRMKGLVWLEDANEQYLIQSVGKRLDLQQKRSWQPSETRQSTIVFIGKELPKAGLEKLLRRCLVQYP